MVEDEKSKGSEPIDVAPDRIKFDYLKSNFFRVVHADGVIGGLTPRLDIHMSVWSERGAIPKQVVHEVGPDGTLGDEIKEERNVRDAIIREVEVGVIIDADVAKLLVDWLREKIDQVEQIRKKHAEQEEGKQ